MLPKKNRLNIRTYFSVIRGTGKKLSSNYFSFYYRQKKDAISNPQINIVVSKKVAKSAIKRNRMRRVLHTAMLPLLPKIPTNTQGIFFVYKDFSNIKTQELQEIIESMLK